MVRGTEQGVAEVLSVQAFMNIVRQNGLILGSIFLLALFGAALYTGLFAERWYEAVSVIRVERAEAEVSLFTATSMDRVDRTFLNNQFETLQSRRILEPVIERLNLNRRLAEMLGSSGSLDTQTSYNYLKRKMLNIQARPNSSVIEISVWAMEPELASRIANEIAYEYEEDRVDFATSGQTEGIAKLKEELALQADLVTKRRDEVEALRNELGLSGIDLNLESAQLELDLLRQMERTLTSLRVEAIARKTRWEQFRGVPRSERFSLINSELIPDSNIQNLIQAYLVQQQEFSRIQERLGTAHPDYISMESNLRTLRNQLTDLLDGYEKSLEINYLEAQSRVEALEEQLVAARSQQIDTATNKLRQFEEAVKNLREEETVLRSIRLAVRQREIDYQVPKRPIEILSEAQTPMRASKPNWFINLGLAGFGGLGLGLIVAYLLAFVDTSIKTVSELEKIFGKEVLGVVGKNAVQLDPELFETIEAEPYRVIQTNLDLLAVDPPLKTLTFQSAGAGEGKSTTLYNVAVCEAVSGRRVLVIDTDLRRPTQYRFFNTNKEPGLGDYFKGNATLAEIVRPSAISGLDFIASGQLIASSLSILLGNKLTEIIEQLKDQYDWIFFDSPPVVGISDASILARMVDGVILIVHHGKNPRAMTERAAQIIHQSKGNFIGTVLNQVPKSSSEDYGYYAYSYSHYDSADSKKTRVSIDPKEEERLDFKE